MRIERGQAGAHVWYTPEWNDNRSSPEPFHVRIRVPSAAEFRDCVLEIRATKGDTRLIELAKDAFVARHVVEVRGLTSESGPILDGAALIKLCTETDNVLAFALIEELDRTIIAKSYLDPGVIPFSDGAPGSSP